MKTKRPRISKTLVAISTSNGVTYLSKAPQKPIKQQACVKCFGKLIPITPTEASKLNNIEIYYI